MKARKPDESDAHYIKRLEDANANLKRESDSIKKWAGALNEAVTALSTEASLAFQAMAEKAGVRSHPSVTAVVELFDTISHPQWRGDTAIPQIKFPQFWDLDGPKAWSGDADMALNAPISDAIELLNELRFSVKKSAIDAIYDVVQRLHNVARHGVEGVKNTHGFKPKHLSPASLHYRDMSKEQLSELCGALGWMALDLAQDMGFANEMLRRDMRAATYRHVCGELYRMSQFAIEPHSDGIDIKVFGREGELF